MEKERYKAFSYRLHQGTADLFKHVCNSTDMSYNRLLFKLLHDYATTEGIPLIHRERPLEDAKESLQDEASKVPEMQE